MSQAYSLLGPFTSRPYAAGERPGNNYIPTIPLLSGRDGWDSLAPYYADARLGSGLRHFARGSARATDHPAMKKASMRSFSKAAAGVAMSSVAGPALRSGMGLKGLMRGLQTKPLLPPGRVPGVDPANGANAAGASFGGPQSFSLLERLRRSAKQPFSPNERALGGAAAALAGTAALTGGAVGLAGRTAEPAAPTADTPRPPEPTLEQRLAAGDVGPPEPTDAQRMAAGETLPGQTLLGAAGKPGQIAQFAGKNWPALLTGGLGAAGLLYLLQQQREKRRREQAIRGLPFVVKGADDLRSFVAEHPLVAGFLRCCGEAQLDEHQIRGKIAQACRIDPTIKEAFVKAAVGIPGQPQPQQPGFSMLGSQGQHSMLGSQGQHSMLGSPQQQPPPAISSPGVQGGKLVGSPAVPDQLSKGPRLFDHYADQAFNPSHDWSQDPTDTASDAAFRWGARGVGALGAGAGAAAGAIAGAPALAAAGRGALTAGRVALPHATRWGGRALLADAMTGSNVTRAIGSTAGQALGLHGEQQAEPPGGMHPEIVMGPDGQPVTTPGQAQAVVQGVQEHISAKAQDPGVKAVGEHISQTGDVPPDVKEQNVKNYSQQFAEWIGEPAQEAAKKIYSMPWQQQLPMWLGLGLGTIGLINALTDEEGGIGNWLMSLLGLGTAAGVAAHGGLLGEGAQNAVQGATGQVGDFVGGLFGGNKPQGSPSQPSPRPDADVLSSLPTQHPWLQQYVGGGSDPQALDMGDTTALLADAKAGKITPDQIRGVRGSLPPGLQKQLDRGLWWHGVRI